MSHVCFNSFTSHSMFYQSFCQKHFVIISIKIKPYWCLTYLVKYSSPNKVEVSVLTPSLIWYEINPCKHFDIGGPLLACLVTEVRVWSKRAIPVGKLWRVCVSNRLSLYHPWHVTCTIINYPSSPSINVTQKCCNFDTLHVAQPEVDAHFTKAGWDKFAFNCFRKCGNWLMMLGKSMVSMGKKGQVNLPTAWCLHGRNLSSVLSSLLDAAQNISMPFVNIVSIFQNIDKMVKTWNLLFMLNETRTNMKGNTITQKCILPWNKVVPYTCNYR